MLFRPKTTIKTTVHDNISKFKVLSFCTADLSNESSLSIALSNETSDYNAS